MKYLIRHNHHPFCLALLEETAAAQDPTGSFPWEEEGKRRANPPRHPSRALEQVAEGVAGAGVGGGVAWEWRSRPAVAWTGSAVAALVAWPAGSARVAASRCPSSLVRAGT